jgi:signal-transduction protein with cAMP-binding, CBS, and nucleotidyltransferase domain
MSAEKVSLTLEKELLAEARVVAGSRALSRYLNRALRHQLQHDRLAGLLAEAVRQQGPIDPRVLAEVREEWPDPGR